MVFSQASDSEQTPTTENLKGDEISEILFSLQQILHQRATHIAGLLDLRLEEDRKISSCFAPPSTTDFLGEVGLNLALSLVFSCFSCQTAYWTPTCCWVE